MEFSKPAALATMMTIAPLTAKAQTPTQPTIEISGETLMNTCPVPPTMTVGQLNGYASSLGTSLSEAVDVTAEEQALAKTNAISNLETEKKALQNKIPAIVKDIEALKVQMNNLINNQSTSATDNDFTAGSPNQKALQELTTKLEGAKMKLDAISEEVPLLKTLVNINDGSIRMEDVRKAFQIWEEASGISCPDTIETYVAINRSFPTSSATLTRHAAGRETGGIGSLGLKDEPVYIDHNPQPSSALWVFVNDVEKLITQANSLIEDARDLDARIAQITIPE